jgi:hypothetical protein
MSYNLIGVSSFDAGLTVELLFLIRDWFLTSVVMCNAQEYVRSKRARIAPHSMVAT